MTELKASDAVTIKNFGHSRGSMWHNGRFFTLDEYQNKTFTIRDANGGACYLIELGHYFAEWMLEPALREPYRTLCKGPCKGLL